jgi:hypothetical protein
MTPPKEKAEELIDIFTFNCRECDYEDNAHQCALMAVEEILNALYSLRFGNTLDDELEYWEEVKQEIEKKQIRL